VIVKMEADRRSKAGGRVVRVTQTKRIIGTGNRENRKKTNKQRGIAIIKTGLNFEDNDITQ